MVCLTMPATQRPGESLEAFRARKRAIQRKSDLKHKEARAETRRRWAYCFRKRRLTIDHIIPVSRGGTHTAGNVVGACFDCNRKKHNTPLIVWMARLAKERAA
jgi:5-methylcytosine-specific restriction endonuclease McrA